MYVSFISLRSLSMIRRIDDRLVTSVSGGLMVLVTLIKTTKSCSVASLMSSSTIGTCIFFSFTGVPPSSASNVTVLMVLSKSSRSMDEYLKIQYFQSSILTHSSDLSYLQQQVRSHFGCQAIQCLLETDLCTLLLAKSLDLWSELGVLLWQLSLIHI